MKTEKKLRTRKRLHGMLTFRTGGGFIILLLLLANWGCQKSESKLSPSSDQGFGDMREASSNNFTQTNLVADIAAFGAANIDTNLVNAWGITFGSSGPIWPASNEEGLSPVYDNTGATLIPAIEIPFGSDPRGGKPTGIVFNNTTSFVIPSTGEVSKFIYATENGTIAAWASGASAITVADRSSSEAVYKGLDFGSSGGTTYLYAANFKGNSVDVFDASFNFVSSMRFVDPNIPAGYAPFNIRNIGGQLYVSYAKQLPPDNEDDDPGPGHGYIDVYSLKGNLISRFASQGTLNSPWGIVKIPNQSLIFIGNFGDGRINIFDTSGNFMSQATSGGSPLIIDGLWGLAFSPVDKRKLYFTAGPEHESHGLLGYLTNR